MPLDNPALDAGFTTASGARWVLPLVRLALAWAMLFALTFTEWREMAHQWWDIDTYGHIVLIPPILAWLVWLRRSELEKITLAGWLPGIAATSLGLAIWLGGRAIEANIVAQIGAVVALQGAVAALLGARAALILAFPLLYSFFLVPFGDEIIPPLQEVTARIAVALTHASGLPAAVHGFFIDTPAGAVLGGCGDDFDPRQRGARVGNHLCRAIRRSRTGRRDRSHSLRLGVFRRNHRAGPGRSLAIFRTRAGRGRADGGRSRNHCVRHRRTQHPGRPRTHAYSLSSDRLCRARAARLGGANVRDCGYLSLRHTQAG